MSASRTMAKAPVSIWPGVIALAFATVYLVALLAVEKQALIIALLLAGIAIVAAAAWFGLLDSVRACFTEHEDALGAYSRARQADPSLESVTVPLDRGLELSTVLA